MNLTVVLLGKVDNLGEKGKIVQVKPGFFRNFLAPKQLATLAGSQAARALMAAMEVQKTEKAHQQEVKKEKKIQLTEKRKIMVEHKKKLLEKKIKK